MTTPYDIGARLARADFEKVAVHAPPEFEKEAFIGLLAKGLSAVGKGLKSVNAFARGVTAPFNPTLIGRGAEAVKATAPGFGQVMKAEGGFGKAILGDMGKTLKGDFTKGWEAFKQPFMGPEGGIGKGLNALRKSDLGSNMMWGSVLGGGFNAATADPGDRLSAFGRGAAWGAVGGAGYKGLHAGASAFRATKPMQALLGNGGAKATLAGAATKPWAVATAGSMMMPTGAAEGAAAHAPQPGLPMTNIPQAY